MVKENRGLGKGLGALLGEASSQADALRKPVGYINKQIVGNTPSPAQTSDIMRIPMSVISPNPYQPRKTFDLEALEELAASIKTLGLIQPITVRRAVGGTYQIISGERRYKACAIAGLTMIPAYVLNADNQSMLEMAIVENIQRRDLDPVEEALSYRRLLEECNLTQEQMADRLGKKRSSVSNMLRLLNLPVKVQHDLKVGLISIGHAKVLLGVEDAAVQEKLCDSVVAEGLNVRQLEALVRKIKSGGKVPSKRTPQPLPEHYSEIADCLGRIFETGVSLKRSSSGKGSLIVKFDSDEQAKTFLDLLKGLRQ